MENTSTENIALFIDFQNIAVKGSKSSNSEHKTEVKSNIKKAINYLKGKGRLIIKRAYADWVGAFSVYTSLLLENSIELTEIPTQYSGKNNADIKLVVDAIEIAITKPYIDTIVIVSGDSDFTPLISKLREFNKKVIVISKKEKSSSLLKGFCDELNFFKDLTEEDVSNYSETNIKYAYDLVRKAHDIMVGGGWKTYGSALKRNMKQIDSLFNETRYEGIGKWSDFLKQAEKDNVITLEETGEGMADWIVHLKTDKK